jgi:hypothetical protein
MSKGESRRDILKLMGVGGVVFASGLAAAAPGKKKSTPAAAQDFFFLQLTDTHWGYSGVSNPRADEPLKAAIATINATAAQPDFIVVTGDLTHDTKDPAVRRRRLTEFKQLTAGLKVKTLHLIPGEHDAAADQAAAYSEIFGPTHHAFDHKGIHFVALDNVSRPGGVVGADQLDWLAADLKKVPADAPVVVFAHRPLFDLYPEWEWATKDGDKVVDVLLAHKHVTVFYGHIHQEHHHQTQHIAHHAARSLIFAMPAAGSVPKKAPVAFDPAAPFQGLGYRRIDTRVPGDPLALVEVPLATPPT